MLVGERIRPIADRDTLNRLALDLIATHSIEQACSVLNALERTKPD